MNIPRTNALLWLATALLIMPNGAKSQDYLHTSGGQIADSKGNVVRLTGLSWFGLETPNYCPHGLWVRSMDSMLDQIRGLGYNMIRVPFSTEMLDPGSTPNGIAYNLNPDLQGLTGLQILDKLVAGARQRGLKIVLDRHRLEPWSQSPLWYDSQYSEARWISDWQMLAQRYNANDTVIGCDLHNEPHTPADWGSGNLSTDWRLAAERAGNAILAVNPHLLIIVEGIGWGSDLTEAAQYPVRLNVGNQLVYSPHDFPNSVAIQPQFYAPNYPANLPGMWDAHWGYLAKQNIAPLWLGEFGTEDVTLSDQQWFQAITNYLLSSGISFSYWCWNPDSGDTGGILEDDWQTVHPDKQAMLQPLLAPLIGGASNPIFTVSGVVSPYTQVWWGEEDVKLSTTQPITALTITITVVKAPGVSYYAQYTNAGGYFTSSAYDNGSAIVYTYTLNPDQVIDPGNTLTAGAQYNGNGTLRSTVNDTYQVTATIGASSQSVNGHF
ncbi:MAG TPA: cellulase family glycosylhydrolase [Chthoniobacterales bacterium]|nr:cellulase family glycosylhydrolase [Chthoniobacterales bacterium]